MRREKHPKAGSADTVSQSIHQEGPSTRQHIKYLAKKSFLFHPFIFRSASGKLNEGISTPLDRKAGKMIKALEWLLD